MPLTTGLIDTLPAFGTLNKYPDRDAWLEGRQGRMTGSKVPSLFGQNPEYRSLYKLWALESGKTTDDFEDDGNKRRGRGMEPLILGELAEANGWDVEHWPQTWTISHPDEAARMSVTPDALAIAFGDGPWFDGETIAVQVKTANQHVFRSLPRNADKGLAMPPEHLLQCQLELACLGLNHGVLCLQPSMDLDDMIQIPYSRSENLIARIIELSRAFWEMVDSGEEPPADGSAATLETLKRLYPNADERAVRLSPEADVAAANLASAKATIKEAKAVAALAKNVLLREIGDAMFGQTPSGECFSCKQQTQLRIDGNKVRDLFPEAAEKCEKVLKFRVLRTVKTIADDLFDADEDDDSDD